MLQGNKDRNTVVLHVFSAPFKARYIRVHPNTWHAYISMRMDIMGCPSGNGFFCYSGRVSDIDTTAIVYGACRAKYRCEDTERNTPNEILHSATKLTFQTET